MGGSLGCEGRGEGQRRTSGAWVPTDGRVGRQEWRAALAVRAGAIAGRRAAQQTRGDDRQIAGTERRGKFAALAVSAGAMGGGWYTRSRGHGWQGQGSKIRGRGAGTCVAADQSEGTRGVKQGCEGTGDSRGEEEGGAKG